MLGGAPTNRSGRDAHAVRVENIAHTVGRHEVIDLFSNLIGQVRRCEEHITDEDGRYMDISFFSRDCARKALCMSGYTVGGVPLSVAAIAPAHSQRRQDRFNQPDDRRNLYVLGLPFNLTKTEFTDLFNRYGTVVHSVILATVDNASRRRGFVVMSTHADAKAAMDNLSRAEVKNHVIDVSWAVVQRSQGFLDGGDRSLPSPTDGPTPLPSGIGAGERSSSPFGGYVHPKRDGPPRGSAYGYESGFSAYNDYEDGSYARNYPSRPSSFHEYTRSGSTDVRTALLVSNIPASIFATEIDLRPLFWPFGEVRKLEIIRTEPASTASSTESPAKPIAKPASPIKEDAPEHERQETKKADTSRSEKLSVIVEYTSALSAAEARAALNGQVYGTCAITVEYQVQTGSGSLSNSPTRSLPSLASSVSSAPSSATGSIPDFSALSIRPSPYDRGAAKRHSYTEFDEYSRVPPLSAGPWQTSHRPQLELTPSSPPLSARSLGPWPAADRYALPPPREYEAPYGRDSFSGGPLHRGAMYDRSNNTSPFNSAVFPPYRRPYSPGPGSHNRSSAYEENYRRDREGENRFGAIARPSSAIARLPPGAPGDAVHLPPAPASNGNSPPRGVGISRSKYDALMSDEFASGNGGGGRTARAFNSMPDVFDFPIGPVAART